MAKILLSAPGEEIASRVAGTVFQQTRYGLCAQRIGWQRLAPYRLQLRERSTFYQVSQAWKALPASVQAQYNAGAPAGMSGYDLFMQRGIPVWNQTGSPMSEYASPVTPVPQSIYGQSITPFPGEAGQILTIFIQLATAPAYPPTFGPLFFFVQKTSGVKPTLELANSAVQVQYFYNFPIFGTRYQLLPDTAQGPITSGDLITYWLTGVSAVNGLTVLEQVQSSITAN